MDNKLQTIMHRALNLLSEEEQMELFSEVVYEHLSSLGSQERPGTFDDDHGEPPFRLSDPQEDLNYAQSLQILAEKLGIADEMGDQPNSSTLGRLQMLRDGRAKPLEHLPCANMLTKDKGNCPKHGTRACSGCRLVSYCSAECQMKHWSIHKTDYKHPLNRDSCSPSWLRDGRKPVFLDTVNEQINLFKAKPHIGHNIVIWGNVPAVDLLNLGKNEGSTYSKDLSLAFVASGDLRNVVKTINNIPTTYKGNIKVVLNDISPPTTARNIILLLILNAAGDSKTNADIALHFWYSIFLPAEYKARLFYQSYHAIKRMESEVLDVTTDTGSRICGDIGPVAFREWLRYIDLSDTNNPAQVADEFKSVMNCHLRKDYAERYYSQLKPAHRLAVHTFRNYGLVHPFGMANAHFTTPNPSLFDPDGRWLQDDGCSPLAGYHIEEILKAGGAHGCKKEDLYGCLYFYLSDQLNTFIERMNQLNITFYLFTNNCESLAKEQKDGKLAAFRILASQRYDRIDVSNTVDDNYVGFQKTIESWGPLLNKKNSSSTLLSYSMNWHSAQPGATTNDDLGATERTMKKLSEAGWWKHGEDSTRIGVFHSIINTEPALYDNSRQFSEFICSRHIPKSVASLNLRVKSLNTIAPHRIGGKLNASWKAARSFETEEEWYQQVCLSHLTFYERYVEFGLASAP